MKIGQAAIQLGVAPHVLRHWEDEGVVVPDRTPAGHRDYTHEHLQRLLVVRHCQDVGLSLSQIRQILHRGEAGRQATIASRLIAIRQQRAQLDAAEAFLSHVQTCRHALLTRCKDCSTYAQARTPGAALSEPENAS